MQKSQKERKCCVYLQVKSLYTFSLLCVLLSLRVQVCVVVVRYSLCVSLCVCDTDSQAERQVKRKIESPSDHTKRAKRAL